MFFILFFITIYYHQPCSCLLQSFISIAWEIYTPSIYICFSCSISFQTTKHYKPFAYSFHQRMYAKMTTSEFILMQFLFVTLRLKDNDLIIISPT